MAHLLILGSAHAVVGLAGYGFLAVAGHALSPAGAAAASAFYLVLGIVGPGVFAGVEQETSRAVSGGGLRAVARRGGLITAGLLVVVLVGVSPVADWVFAGDGGMLGAVALGVVGAAAAHLVRGLLAGTGRFLGYATTLLVEGLTRIALVAVLAADATAYAVGFAAALLVAAVAGLPWLRGPHPGGTAPPMAGRAGLLVVGGFGVQAVANLVPVVVTARLAADPATAAAFAAAFVLVRTPVLVFTTAQVVLLPALTRAAAAGDRAALGRVVRGLVLAVVALGVPGVALAATVGGRAVTVLFGAEVVLPGWLMAVLALSSLLLMAAHVLQAVLVACGGHRAVAAAWAAGAGSACAALLPGDPAGVGAWAQLAACALVVGGMIATLVTGSGLASVPEPARAGYRAWSRRPL